MNKKLLILMLCIAIISAAVILSGCGGSSSQGSNEKPQSSEQGGSQNESTGSNGQPSEQESESSNVETEASSNTTGTEQGSNTTESNSGTTEENPTSKGLKFAISEDKTYYVVISIGDCSDTTVTIPEIYEGLPVTQIAPNAFKDCTHIEKIVLPDSITVIGEKAFNGCTILIEIILSTKLEIIEDSAFEGCIKLESMKLPSSLESIGNAAFKDCESLNSIALPEKITEIGASTFAGCESLEEIDFMGAIVRIEIKAFEGCAAIIEIKLPASVEFIGENAFSFCEDLVKISLSESLKEVGADIFTGCPSLEDVIVTSKDIPKGLENAIDKEKVEITVEHTEHTMAPGAAKAPNCTESGWEEYEYCTVCGYSTKTYIDPLGHDEKINPGTKPTCTQSGFSDSIYCGRCYQDIYYGEYLEPLGHTEVIDEEGKMPTCTEGGYSAVSHCSVCSATVSERLDLPAAHIVEEGVCINCNKPFDTWDGSYDTLWYNSSLNEFTLNTAEELAGFMQLVNSGITFSGTTIKLGTNMEMSMGYWTPIGTTNSVCFDGTFDGQNYTVYHLDIAITTKYIGFFGYNKGDIKNLNVSFDIGVAQYAGMLIAYNDGGNITNCSATGSIYGSASNVIAGGLIGYSEYGELTECNTNVNIHVWGQEVFAGGLAGRFPAGKVVSCYALGDVITPVSYNNGKVYAGGLIGSFGYASYAPKIESSYAKGNVNAGSSMSATKIVYAGGLVGNISGMSSCHITDSYCTGNVSGHGQDISVGGFAGFCQSGYIKSCYATGDVTSKTVSKNSKCGGLIGNATAHSHITRSHASGSVSSTSTASNANVEVGGLVGNAFECNIDRCYFDGTISVNSYWSFVGGLVGNNASMISDCYVSADISASSNMSYVYVGGIVGLNSEYESYESHSTITNCYSAGTISAFSANESAMAGGIKADGYGSGINCYSFGNISASVSGTGDTTVNPAGDNCYRNSEQTITATGRGKNEILTGGTAVDPSTILTESFHTSTLGWSSDIWDFSGLSEGKLPTLKP